MKYPVVLASASPRRQELLEQITPNFQVAVAAIDEDAFGDPDPWKAAERIASAKATEVAQRYPEALVIAGDTIVAYERAGSFHQLAKPSDHQDAAAMLTQLSGRSHVVITGICIASPEGRVVLTDTTHVTFRMLGSNEIQRYVASGEPMDKAGAYAVQGGASAFVADLQGSLSNVIGLPVEKLREKLVQLNLL